MRYRSWKDWSVDYESTEAEESSHELTRIAWVSNCEDEDEADQIQTWYEKAMSKRSSYLCACLANHLMWHAYMYQPDPADGSTLVGNIVGDLFVASHFAPATRRGGIKLLQTAAKAGTPFVFAVPENLAAQLIRLGFVDTGVTVPQWFNGACISKTVVTNQATTQEDLAVLAEHFLGNQ